MNWQKQPMNSQAPLNNRSSTKAVSWSNTFSGEKKMTFLCFIKINHNTMKKLITNSNPFILLLIPVLFALVMGVSYQFEQTKVSIERPTVQATSLFNKSVNLVKTVCSIAKTNNVW
jgi:hypothetical protein